MEKMMKTSDFYYNLPEELIAQTPIEPRNRLKPLFGNAFANREEKQKREQNFPLVRVSLMVRLSK